MSPKLVIGFHGPDWTREMIQHRQEPQLKNAAWGKAWPRSKPCQQSGQLLSAEKR